MTESKYIEKQALRDKLYEADAITMEGVRIINQFPPADVRPNHRSKWLRFMGGSDYQCPECNWGTSYDIPRKFCPNCGADFTGGGADG